MPWKLVNKTSFERDVCNLSPAEQKRIRDAVRALGVAMNQSNKAKDFRKIGRRWRLRVGCWRVFFELDSTTGKIYAVAVERRTTTTY